MFIFVFFFFFGFFFQAEDGIRDLVRSRGLGDVYKRQVHSLLKRAAEIQGRTLSDFVVSVAREAALRVVEDAELSLIHI